MRILLIHQAFTTIDEPGGTRHHEFARQLADDGHEVYVIAGQVSYLTGRRIGKWALVERELQDGVQIWRCLSYAGWHRSFLHRMFSFLTFTISAFVGGLMIRDVDLVWGTSPPIFQAVAALGLARLKRAVFLLEIRDLWPYFAIAVGVLRQPILIRLSEWLERVLINGADQIVVNSPGFVDHVRNRGGQEIEVVPNGVDPNMFPKDASGSAFRGQYQVDDRFVAMYTGAHGLSNDLEVLLEAAQLVQAQQEQVHFVLVGDGKEKAALQASAQRKDLKNVTFAPPIAKVEMADALAAAQVCIAILQPIQAYTTTYPNKVFDYMAAGRPIILAIDGAIRVVVEDAGAGVFVPPGDPAMIADAVLRLFGSPEDCRQMGERGRAYVSEHFDRAKLAARMEEIMVAACEAHSDGKQVIESDTEEVGN